MRKRGPVQARRGVVGGLLTAVLGVLLAGCVPAQDATEHHGQGDRDQGYHGIGHASRVPQTLRVEITQVLPHDPTAFTQGLEIDDGTLYEGTGLVGHSTVSALDPVTAAPRMRAPLSPPLFGEGITAVGDRLWQLTWRDGVAIERSRTDLRELRRVSYAGEGWGVCFQPPAPETGPRGRLVMSDGSNRLTFRDPDTFAPLGSVLVRRAGSNPGALNELECTGSTVWSNVYGSDTLLRIDPNAGEVTGVADATGLLAPQQRATAGVLNGIAALPGTDEFLLTGKNWPAMFRVRLRPT